MIPGRDGAALLCGPFLFRLRLAGQITGREKPEDLIERQQAELVKHFGGVDGPAPNAAVPQPGLGQVVVDRGGAVWMLDGNGNFRVRVEGRWEDARPALADAMGAERFVPEQLTPVGNGSKVYVLGRGMTPMGLLGGVEGGKPRFTKAPGASANAIVVRDGQGGLWLPYSDRDPVSGNYVTVVRRVTHEGETCAYTDRGVPVAADPVGLVWFAQAGYSKQTRLSLWGGGRFLGEVDLGVQVNAYAPLFSDRSGSLFAWTSAGLHHYVAEEPTRPESYRKVSVHQVLSPDGVALPPPGNPRYAPLRVSALGYAVFSDRVLTGEADGNHVVLVPLPER